MPENPFTRPRGYRIAGPAATSEADHFFRCEECGGSVDKRDFHQVLHHSKPGHAGHNRTAMTRRPAG